MAGDPVLQAAVGAPEVEACRLGQPVDRRLPRRVGRQMERKAEEIREQPAMLPQPVVAQRDQRQGRAADPRLEMPLQGEDVLDKQPIKLILDSKAASWPASSADFNELTVLLRSW
jgi:hypothetical protein